MMTSFAHDASALIVALDLYVAYASRPDVRVTADNTLNFVAAVVPALRQADAGGILASKIVTALNKSSRFPFPEGNARFALGPHGLDKIVLQNYRSGTSENAAPTLIFASKFFSSDSHEDALAYVTITQEGLNAERDVQGRAKMAAISTSALTRIARVADRPSRILAINRLFVILEEFPDATTATTAFQLLGEHDMDFELLLAVAIKVLRMPESAKGETAAIIWGVITRRTRACIDAKNRPRLSIILRDAIVLCPLSHTTFAADIAVGVAGDRAFEEYPAIGRRMVQAIRQIFHGTEADITSVSRIARWIDNTGSTEEGRRNLESLAALGAASAVEHVFCEDMMLPSPRVAAAIRMLTRLSQCAPALVSVRASWVVAMYLQASIVCANDAMSALVAMRIAPVFSEEIMCVAAKAMKSEPVNFNSSETLTVMGKCVAAKATNAIHVPAFAVMHVMQTLAVVETAQAEGLSLLAHYFRATSKEEGQAGARAMASAIAEKAIHQFGSESPVHAAATDLKSTIATLRFTIKVE